MTYSKLSYTAMYWEHVQSAKPQLAEELLETIKKCILTSSGAFYITDLAFVSMQLQKWRECLPRVEPFYAIKCQPDPRVLELLAYMGAGFDCSSRSEIASALKAMKDANMKRGLLVDPSAEAAKRIVYANPFKFKKDMAYALSHGISLATFDSLDELYRLAREWPDACLLLRLSPPRVFNATCVLADKFGAALHEIPILLATAKRLGMQIVGVCFHVGSGCQDAEAWAETVAEARQVFDIARGLGFTPYLLDVGGGFTGSGLAQADCQLHRTDEFAPLSLYDATNGVGIDYVASRVGCTCGQWEAACANLSIALDIYFPVEMNVRIIAEPGRYFAAGAFTLCTQVIGRHELCLQDVSLGDSASPCSVTTSSPLSGLTDACTLQPDEFVVDAGAAANVADPDNDNGCGSINRRLEGTTRVQRYVVADGLYGSFNCIIFDHARPLPACTLLTADGVYKTLSDCRDTEPSIMYGPSCDSFDCISVRPEGILLTPVALPNDKMAGGGGGGDSDAVVPGALDSGMGALPGPTARGNLSQLWRLPRLSVGDWIVWPGMGAYSAASAGSHFNGIPPPQIVYLPTKEALMPGVGVTLRAPVTGAALFASEGGCDHVSTAVMPRRKVKSWRIYTSLESAAEAIDFFHLKALSGAVAEAVCDKAAVDGGGVIGGGGVAALGLAKPPLSGELTAALDGTGQQQNGASEQTFASDNKTSPDQCKVDALLDDALGVACQGSGVDVVSCNSSAVGDCYDRVCADGLCSDEPISALLTSDTGPVSDMDSGFIDEPTSATPTGAATALVVTLA